MRHVPRQSPLSRRFRLLSDEKGTAMTETAIMLPALILIWGGILYAFTLAQQIVQMHVAVRRDAWTYAYSGCNDEPDGETAISEESYRDGAPDTDTGTPFGNIMNLFIDQFHANRNGEATAPSVIGGHTNAYHSDITWLCNETVSDYSIVSGISNVMGFSF